MVGFTRRGHELTNTCSVHYPRAKAMTTRGRKRATCRSSMRIRAQGAPRTESVALGIPIAPAKGAVASSASAKSRVVVGEISAGTMRARRKVRSVLFVGNSWLTGLRAGRPVRDNWEKRQYATEVIELSDDSDEAPVQATNKAKTVDLVTDSTVRILTDSCETAGSSSKQFDGIKVRIEDLEARVEAIEARIRLAQKQVQREEAELDAALEELKELRSGLE